MDQGFLDNKKIVYIVDMLKGGYIYRILLKGQNYKTLQNQLCRVLLTVLLKTK